MSRSPNCAVGDCRADDSPVAGGHATSYPTNHHSGILCEHAGSPVSAVLIAPVVMDGEAVLQAGSTLSGRVKAVTRVGFGVRHETAGLELEFNQITPLDGGRDADCRASRGGGQQPRARHSGWQHSGSSLHRQFMLPSERLHKNTLQWEVHAELAEWVIRSLHHGTSRAGDLLSRRRRTHAELNPTPQSGCAINRWTSSQLPASSQTISARS